MRLPADTELRSMPRLAGVGPAVARRGVASAAATPPRRGTDVLPLTLARDGRIADERHVERIARRLPEATDCFVFCHGWLHDEAEALQAAGRFFALLDGVLTPMRERVLPLRVALHWPSKPFAGGTRAGGEGLWPEIERRVSPPTRGSRSDVAALLLELGRGEVAVSPEEEAELDLLLRRLRVAQTTRGALPASPFHALSFWVMKRRAGDVGERLGRDSLAPLWRSLTWAPRLHLVGHSFGAKLATSAVRGGARPESLTLLLAAFSAFAFAPRVPGFKRPGFYHGVLADRQVQGPVVVLRSDHDTALGTFYPLVSHGQADRSRAPRPTRPGRQGRVALVGASALGAVGARGVGASEVDLVLAQQTGIPSYPIVNVDGSAVVRAREPFMGAHRDILHPEVATLVAMAAGLLVGGPDGARPVPVDPRVSS